MKREAEVVVIQKTYDFILWITNHVGKFPRLHRFTLGDRLLEQIYSLLEDMIEAKYAKGTQKVVVHPENWTQKRAGLLLTA